MIRDLVLGLLKTITSYTLQAVGRLSPYFQFHAARRRALQIAVDERIVADGRLRYQPVDVVVEGGGGKPQVTRESLLPDKLGGANLFGVELRVRLIRKDGIVPFVDIGRAKCFAIDKLKS